MVSAFLFLPWLPCGRPRRTLLRWGGRLGRFVSLWAVLGGGTGLVECPLGSSLPFLSPLPLSLVPVVLSSYREGSVGLQGLQGAVLALLAEDAIEPVAIPALPGFFRASFCGALAGRLLASDSRRLRSRHLSETASLQDGVFQFRPCLGSGGGLNGVHQPVARLYSVSQFALLRARTWVPWSGGLCTSSGPSLRPLLGCSRGL